MQYLLHYTVLIELHRSSRHTFNLPRPEPTDTAKVILRAAATDSYGTALA
jgi:hypothetical protein